VTFAESVDWLYSLQLHGIRLGLENMRRLCAEADIALTGERAPAFFHVAGTNGKGSVCAMLDALGRAAGLRTGLYTSPHLVTFRERIRLDGAMIPSGDVAGGLTQMRSIIEKWDHPPTFFEVATALALGWFQQKRAEVVVLETGLGGRLDATNVVIPRVSVLTPIGLDHQAYLGSTLTVITGEKCGIIKPGVPVVSAPQVPEAEAVIREAAARAGSTLQSVEQPISDSVSLSLRGSHQRRNAALALAAMGAAGMPAEVSALADVQWPGRFQAATDRLTLDGAHNPAAARTLAATWREMHGEAKATIVLAVMRDKDAQGIAAELAAVAARFITCRVENPRSHTADSLAAEIRATAPEIECIAADRIADAHRIALTFANPIVAAGSLFLVGEALAALGLAEAVSERSSQ
jgi:dihydrofolate synthase / folylpolyglutamate synthase